MLNPSGLNSLGKLSLKKLGSAYDLIRNKEQLMLQGGVDYDRHFQISTLVIVFSVYYRHKSINVHFSF